MSESGQIIGREVSCLSNKIRRVMENYSTKCEYSGAQSKTLHFLLTNSDRDIYQREIEEVYGLRPASASQLLKKMEESGLIVRESSDSDARMKKIIMTDKALQYQDQMVHDLNELEGKLVYGIADEDLEVFYRVIKQMIQNLSD